MKFLTALVSRFIIAAIPIGLKLHRPVVKQCPLKYQQVIPGNQTLATQRQSCSLNILCKIIQILTFCNVTCFEKLNTSFKRYG